MILLSVWSPCLQWRSWGLSFLQWFSLHGRRSSDIVTLWCSLTTFSRHRPFGHYSCTLAFSLTSFLQLKLQAPIRLCPFLTPFSSPHPFHPSALLPGLATEHFLKLPRSWVLWNLENGTQLQGLTCLFILLALLEVNTRTILIYLFLLLTFC